MAVKIPAANAYPRDYHQRSPALPSAFERFHKTFATTPSPNSTRTRVPMNSPKHSSDVRLLFYLGPLSNLVHPIEGLVYRAFPQPVHFLSFLICQIRFPGVIDRPVRTQVLDIFEIVNSQTCGVGRPQRSSGVTRDRTNYR